MTYDLEPGLQPTDGTADVEAAAPSGVGNHRDNPWPVSLLSEKFYTAVERWPSVWVAGQITQINTRRQGSAYITLRDDQQDIAMEVNGFGRFAAAAAPFAQGDRVIITQAERVDEAHVAVVARRRDHAAGAGAV